MTVFYRSMIAPYYEGAYVVFEPSYTLFNADYNVGINLVLYVVMSYLLLVVILLI